MTGHRIRLGNGWRIKDGKPVRTDAHLDVSTRLKRKSSKRVRVGKRTAPS